MEIREVLDNVKLGKGGAEYIDAISERSWFIAEKSREMRINADTCAGDVVKMLMRNDFSSDASLTAFFALEMVLSRRQIDASLFG